MESKFYAKQAKQAPSVVLSWDSFDKAIDRLQQTLLSSEQPTRLKGVYGIPRGGLVLAVRFTHILSLPLLQAPVDDCLIVDDIYDTGRQADPLLEKYVQTGNSIFMSWYVSQAQQGYVDTQRNVFYTEVKEDKDWLIFPWEI